MENLVGNKYSAVQDRLGNWTITRYADNATCYLQGDDSVSFEDEYRGLSPWTLQRIRYPFGPHKTAEDHIDSLP